MARFMIVRGSEPLADARVKVEGTDDLFKTDDEGRLEVNFGDTELEGSVVLKVSHAAGTFRREVDVEPKSSLTVVNVGTDRETGGQSPLDAAGNGSFNSQGEALRERYDVKGRLGSGGMGVVVKAYDTVLERIVAIKILSDELAEYDEARQIFMREVRNLATLSHPNLVAVYDVVENAKRPLMITEYVNGMTLEQIIQSERVLPQSSVLQIAVQLARAVEYLHAEDVVHRDIKPGNIMLKEDGSLKIIDFGLARSLKNITDQSTRVRGTPAYMAPEQIEGDELSNAIDIYQIGVTLHEVASGQLPFQEGDVGYKHVHEEPPYLGDLVPNILPGLADLVHVCLSKDPGDRPANATVLREEAERLHSLLTSSRVTRDNISKPNLGGRASSDITQSTNPGVGPAGSGSSPNMGGSQSGVRESQSPSSASDSEPGCDESAGKEMDTELSFASSGRWGLVAVIVLVLVGVGGYFAWREYGATGGGSEATASSNAPSPDPAPSENKAGDEPKTAEAKKKGSETAIPNASTKISRAVVASKTAAQASEGRAGARESDGPPNSGGAPAGSRRETGQVDRGGRAPGTRESAGRGAPSPSSSGSSEPSSAGTPSASDDSSAGAESPSDSAPSAGTTASEESVAAQEPTSEESSETGDPTESPSEPTAGSSDSDEPESETMVGTKESEGTGGEGSSSSDSDGSTVEPMDSPGFGTAPSDGSEPTTVTENESSGGSDQPEESSEEPAQDETSEEDEDDSEGSSVPMSF